MVCVPRSSLNEFTISPTREAEVFEFGVLRISRSQTPGETKRSICQARCLSDIEYTQWVQINK